MFPALYGRRPSAANKTTALLLFVAAVVFSARIVFAVTAADHGPSLSDEREIPGVSTLRDVHTYVYSVETVFFFISV